MEINIHKLSNKTDMHLIVCGVAVTTAQTTDVSEPQHLLRVTIFLTWVQSWLQYIAVCGHTGGKICHHLWHHTCSYKDTQIV